MDADTVSIAGAWRGEAMLPAEGDLAQLSPDPEARRRRLRARLSALLLHAAILALLILGPLLQERPIVPVAIPVELVTLPPPPAAAKPTPAPPPAPPLSPLHRESGGNPDRQAGRPSEQPKAAESPQPNPAPPPATPAKPAERAVAPPPKSPALPKAAEPTESAPETKAEQLADIPPPPLPPATAVKPSPAPSPLATRHPPARAHKPIDSNLRGEGGGDRYLNALRDRVMGNLRYPPATHGLAGEAVYMLRLSREGKLLWVSVMQSTGERALDRVGIDALTRSAPFPPPPPDIPGTEVVLYFTLHMAP
ncbi:MAG TPA: TonB family protein [Alphaproteobacteria bacterium]|nr:TonB family protein [Alphaproteobacteria bacterium]